METLTVEINNPSTIQAIAAAASQHGVTAKSYVLGLLEEALLSQKSFEEIVEPLAQSFDESQMTEEELDALIEAERQAIWDEKHSQQQ